MRFDKQSIQSRNLGLSIASVEELNNKKYKMKRHVFRLNIKLIYIAHRITSSIPMLNV